MAKNYSVEWLSQSFHSSSTTVGLERAKDAAVGFLKPHVPCVVQPRAPTFYKEISVEPKTRQKTPLVIEKEEDLKDTSNVYTPASPTSKYLFYWSGKRCCLHCGATDCKHYSLLTNNVHVFFRQLRVYVGLRKRSGR